MDNITRRTILGLCAAAGLAACQTNRSAPTPVNAPPNPFDDFYDKSFRLSELSSDPIPAVSRPEVSAGLGDAVIDPTYATRIYRITAATPESGAWLRHEYSRRQVFNADNSRFLAQGENGSWSLHDATTFERIRVLERLEGDCEPLWDPHDPARFIHTARNGATTWWDQDGNVVLDLAGKTPWGDATSFWTKGEGGLSADGRRLALMATRYDEATQKNSCFGIVTVDPTIGKVIGTLDAQDFPTPGAFPDHVSIAPSGKRVVVSWLAGQGGTVAYDEKFKDQRRLIDASEHSDLAIGAAGEDLLVVADYGAGQITAINVENGERTNLHTLYPASGEAYACHISGQCFDRPGWVVVSSYADHTDSAPEQPAPTLRPEYRKVWLLELRAGGRALNVAHIHANWDDVSGDSYFLEPHASASRDLSRIVFASNWGGGEINDYLVGLPSWVWTEF